MIDYTKDDNFGKSQSCSPSTCSFSENASEEKSDFEIVVEGRPLHVDQIHISPKDLHDYMNISLLEEDDQPITIFVSEENFIAIQDKKYENLVETEHVESDCFRCVFLHLSG